MFMGAALSIAYEALISPGENTHKTWPHLAIRTHQWKYIATYHPVRREERVFEELYNLVADPLECENLAGDDCRMDTLIEMRQLLVVERKRIGAKP